MHVHVIFTYYPFEYSYIFCIAYLHNDISTSFLYITFEYTVSVLCYPYYMYLYLAYCMVFISHLLF